MVFCRDYPGNVPFSKTRDAHGRPPSWELMPVRQRLERTFKNPVLQLDIEFLCPGHENGRKLIIAVRTLLPSLEFRTHHPEFWIKIGSARVFRINLAPKPFQECGNYATDSFHELPARTRNLVVQSLWVAEKVIAGRKMRWHTALSHMWLNSCDAIAAGRAGGRGVDPTPHGKPVSAGGTARIPVSVWWAHFGHRSGRALPHPGVFPMVLSCRPYVILGILGLNA